MSSGVLAEVVALLPACPCCGAREALVAEGCEVYACGALDAGCWCECTEGWQVPDPVTVCVHVHAVVLLLAELAEVTP